MSKSSTTVTIHFDKNGTAFTRTFSDLDINTIGNKEDAENAFVNNYKGIVDGTASTFDFSVVEKGIEL